MYRRAEILTQFGRSSRVMIYLGCVTIRLPLSERTIECVRADGCRTRSGASDSTRVEGGKAAGGATSLDQVSPARRYKEWSPPLPVLSVQTYGTECFLFNFNYRRLVYSLSDWLWTSHESPKYNCACVDWNADALELSLTSKIVLNMVVSTDQQEIDMTMFL